MNSAEEKKLLTRASGNLLCEKGISDQNALDLAGFDDLNLLMSLASEIRDRGFGQVVTYSKKVFIPLTKLCRDVCHYCTFATTPRHIEQPFMSVEQVLEQVQQAKKSGCKEVLFTLGEKPELRYRVAREWLSSEGFNSTIDYVIDVAQKVLKHTGLLPHINAGTLTPDEIKRLREVSASMGIMLESASDRLCNKGMPHFGSPDKVPAVRLATLIDAGIARVAMTTGILIGIGETRQERIESLLEIRRIHRQYGHIQEIIIQNFRAKPDTKMAHAPEPDLSELLWTLSVARIIFGPDMSIQVPPNLSPGLLPQLVAAGINDWGGVSPVTPDFVNPEAPWPELLQLAAETAKAGKYLDERLTIYPGYALQPERWLSANTRPAVLNLMDGQGFARADAWIAGTSEDIPADSIPASRSGPKRVTPGIAETVLAASNGERLCETQIASLFTARGQDFDYLCQSADKLRQTTAGDDITFVINRNINYTNVCYFNCQFCAFSKGKLSEQLRGRPYDLDMDEIARRVREALARGATEVCMQGGIHPDYTGQTYLDILDTVRNAEPEVHIHAFSPLEVWQGAATSGMTLEDYLRQLKSAGLHTLPGTAAEILDDEVRDILCPDKINTAQWLEVMETAHNVGFKTTATIMFGHVDSYEHWARHLLAIRDLQARTGGFTEFVPLPFVGQEAPLYLKGKSRSGPTFREAVLMHAIARLVLHPHISNIQASWVKMGLGGVSACLNAGANDLGGTLMNESITRAAGATHGQELAIDQMETLIKSLGRTPRQRTTLYEEPPAHSRDLALGAVPLAMPVQTPVSFSKGKFKSARKITN